MMGNDGGPQEAVLAGESVMGLHLVDLACDAGGAPAMRRLSRPLLFHHPMYTAVTFLPALPIASIR